MSVRGNDRSACMRTRVGAKGGQPQVTRAQRGRGWGAGMRGAVGPMGRTKRAGASERRTSGRRWMMNEEVGLHGAGRITVERGDGWWV